MRAPIGELVEAADVVGMAVRCNGDQGRSAGEFSYKRRERPQTPCRNRSTGLRCGHAAGRCWRGRTDVHAVRES